MKQDSEYPDCIEFIEEETQNDETSDGYGDGLVVKSEYEETMIDESTVASSRKSAKYNTKTTRGSPGGKIAKKMIRYSAAPSNDHKCRKCAKTFTTVEEAREHNKTHSNEEKVFQCELCPKNFKSRYQLTLHTRSHTGEKPFVCHLCNRAFTMSSNLQKHMVRKTKLNFDLLHTNSIQPFRTPTQPTSHTNAMSAINSSRHNARSNSTPSAITSLKSKSSARCVRRLSSTSHT